MALSNFHLALLALLPGVQAAAQPWLAPFAPDSRAIITSAASIVPSETASVTVLLEDHSYKIHAGGKTDRVIRKVYRIDRQDAIEDWSSVEQPYQPWYQQTPELKARVIGTDGSVSWLDPKTISNAPEATFDPSMFSDARVLRAPLPGVAQGAIVEYELKLIDTAPLLDAGVTERIVIPTGFSLQKFRFRLESEPGIAVRTVVKRVPNNALHKVSDTRFECELGPLAPETRTEWNLPSDVPPYPYIAFSTGRSWQAVAARYSAIVDQRLTNSNVSALLKGVDRNAKPIDLAGKLVANLHQAVRYTGVEFGDNAIIPGSPAETIKRGYGDCKDKAVLLTALLRAAGLPAHVALLSASYGLDVDPSLPGLGMFNHAIVHVESVPPLWIDATASNTRVGFLPSADEGRLVLVADQATQGLIATPAPSSSQKYEHQKIEIQMSDFGYGKATITAEVGGGSSESTVRGAFGRNEPKAKEQIETFVKKSLMAKSLAKYEAMRRDDFSGPFRMTAEALECKVANTGANDAAVAISPASLFQYLPFALTNDAETKANSPKPREDDFIIQEPYRMDMHYIIHPPVGFKASKLPQAVDVKAGDAAFSKTYESKLDGTVDVFYRFDSGKSRLSPAEFIALRAMVKANSPARNEVFVFLPGSAEAVALGESGIVISSLRKQIGAAPENAVLHIRLSSALLSAGLGDAALLEAQTAVKLDPTSAAAYIHLGSIYQHDTFGRLRQGDWNLSEAEKAYRKAIALDPESELARYNLAILLEYNPQGWRLWNRCVSRESHRTVSRTDWQFWSRPSDRSQPGHRSLPLRPDSCSQRTVCKNLRRNDSTTSGFD